MAINKERSNLTREVLEQLLGETGGDGMPVILAKRQDPQIPTTGTLTDYGFEGLTRIDRGGKVQWEPNHNFVLYIDGETGNCRIPDTENNRKRLKRLSQGGQETVTRLVLDEDGQTTKQDEVIPIPPTYKMMEQNLATSTLINTVAQQVMNMMKGGIQQESDAPLPPGVVKRGSIKDNGRKTGLIEPLPSIMDPIK
jgi:hypothetical protein